jgi:hypothetical protein
MGVLVSKILCPRKYVSDGLDFKILVVLGQSNAVGSGIEPTDAEMTTYNNVMQSDRIFQFGRFDLDQNHVLSSSEPIQNWYDTKGSDSRLISYATTTAKRYVDTYPGKNVLVVNCASRLTGFNRSIPYGTWNAPDGIWFRSAVNRINTALNLGGNNQVIGFLCSMGESDVLFNTPPIEFQSSLTNMINTFRDGKTIPTVTSDTPFLINEMCYTDFITPSETQTTKDQFSNLQTVIYNISQPGSIPSSATVLASLDGLSKYSSQVPGLPANTIDFNGNPIPAGTYDLHFNPASTEELGNRFFAALKPLLQ